MKCKTLLILAGTLVCSGPSFLRAAEEVLVLGDSLSKEYSVEFPHLDARNWLEILDAERHEEFDAGSFEVYPDFRATGHEYNWSFPGATTEEMLDNLTGDGFFQKIAQEELEDQLEDEVNRVVIFLGGNDVDKEYDRLYAGEETDDITNAIYGNLVEILHWVKSRNPSLDIVLVNVPHVGATPKVKKEHGTNPENVANVTAALSDLNKRLEQFAREENIGYADIFTITTDLLEEKPFCISGVPFIDESHSNAAKFYLWLGGALADEFHPNTNAQAVVANTIVSAFNRHFEAGITPLGGTEILGELLDIEPDRSFEEWIACYELGDQAGAGADGDHDGWDNFMEFVFDMDPTKRDAPPLTVTGPYQVTFRPRLRQSEHFSWTVETSTGLEDWTPTPASALAEAPFGAYQWSAPDPAPAEFFVRVTLTKP